MAVLELKNVSLKFGGLKAIDNLSFKVTEGEVFSIIGPNGAGKTSVFNLISGLYTASKGEIFFNEQKLIRSFSLKNFLSLFFISLFSGVGLLVLTNIQSLWETVIYQNYIYQQPFPWINAFNNLTSFYQSLPSNSSLLPFIGGFFLGILGYLSLWFRSRNAPNFVARQGIARTFQNIRLFSQLSVYENVLIGSEASDDHSQSKIIDLLEFVGLSKKLTLKSRDLSYGDQRRLEIARALATKPKLLLLDEPAAGMNPTETLALVELIRKIQNQGITVILIDHHMRVIMTISNHIVVLNYGNKIAEGTPEEIKSNPQVIEAYLGGE